MALRASEGESWLSNEIGRCAGVVRKAGWRQRLAADQVRRMARALDEIGGSPLPTPPAPAPVVAAEPVDDDLFDTDDPPGPEGWMEPGIVSPGRAASPKRPFP